MVGKVAIDSSLKGATVAMTLHLTLPRLSRTEGSPGQFCELQIHQPVRSESYHFSEQI